MKTVLFVPGFQEDLNSRNYTATIKAIKSCGYDVRFVPITWKHTTISDWAKELEKNLAKYKSKEVILAGFSFGAMIALVAATEWIPAQLWLFSLSPYFVEDLKSGEDREEWLQEVGKRRTEDFARLEFDELVKHIKCKTLLFVGQREIDKWPTIGERARIAHKLIPKSELIIVPNAGHDVTNSDYVKAITSKI